MKSGTAATGTEMSCLIEPPSGFCAADISSRSFQNAWRWLEVCRDHRIVDDAVLHALAPRIASSVARASSRGDDSSISTYQGCLLGQRIADVDAVTDREIDRDLGEQLEAGQAAGSLVLRNRQQLQRIAPATSGRQRRSRPRAASETVFSVAAVMMPSVPSAPMNRLRRS